MSIEDQLRRIEQRLEGFARILKFCARDGLTPFEVCDCGDGCRYVEGEIEMCSRCDGTMIRLDLLERS